jgi:hypothetical protein
MPALVRFRVGALVRNDQAFPLSGRKLQNRVRKMQSSTRRRLDRRSIRCRQNFRVASQPMPKLGEPDRGANLQSIEIDRGGTGSDNHDPAAGWRSWSASHAHALTATLSTSRPHSRSCPAGRTVEDTSATSAATGPLGATTGGRRSQDWIPLAARTRPATARDRRKPQRTPERLHPGKRAKTNDGMVRHSSRATLLCQGQAPGFSPCRRTAPTRFRCAPLVAELG